MSFPTIGFQDNDSHKIPATLEGDRGTYYFYGWICHMMAHFKVPGVL